MRPLEQSETAILSGLKGKNSKEGAYTRDAGEVSIDVLTVVEEASHSLGQHLAVIGDEALLEVRDTFAGEQGTDEKMVEDLQNKILYEAGQCIPIVGGCHFEEPAIIIVQ
jgi:hypothetical protein